MNPCPISLIPSDAAVSADTFHFERSLLRQGLTLVAGLDEAGRGPLAGPVVAACVILPLDCAYQDFQDSKRLSAARREELHAELHRCGAVIGVGEADAREIETHNILQATLLAMGRALTACTVENQGQAPDFLLVDGTSKVPVAIGQLTLTKGESKSASIAAASIIAKVTRDRLMAEADRQYPQYGFVRHQGYGTREHQRAIERHGPCPLHRRTFRGVAQFLPRPAETGPRQQELW